MKHCFRCRRIATRVWEVWSFRSDLEKPLHIFMADKPRHTTSSGPGLKAQEAHACFACGASGFAALKPGLASSGAWCCFDEQHPQLYTKGSAKTRKHLRRMEPVSVRLIHKSLRPGWECADHQKLYKRTCELYERFRRQFLHPLR